MKLNEKSISELSSMLDRGEIQPVDIACDIIGAIRERESGINAYLEVYADELLRQAKDISKEPRMSSSPLAGIPIAIKDNICIKDRRTTCASKILEDYVSPYDATVIKRLKEAGALIIGKTNMDEFAMGSSSENSAFGPTKNPWEPSHTPGGSSSGSAAAVAADMAIAALGSDTGGSVRQPAGFCGVVGMKPTYGRISRYGLVAFASSLDQIGPITKCVEDMGLLLPVLCGEDEKDATTLVAGMPDIETDLSRGIGDFTIGIPWDFLHGEMDEEVTENFDAVVNLLEKEKIPVIDVSLRHAAYAVSCYYIIADAEASSNLARYDGVRYGHRAKEYADIASMYTSTRTEGFGEEVKRRILLGTYVLSEGYRDAYYLQAQKVRSLIIRDFEDAFNACDIIMLPTSPTPAFAFGEKMVDPLLMYLCDVFTVLANLAGLPAISIPCGLSKEGLPLAVQLLGRAVEDGNVIRCAYGLQELIGFKGRAFE